MVVLHKDLQTALKIAKNEANESSKVSNPVCHIDSRGNFSYTAPTTFMDGIYPPSPSAIKLLLQPCSPSRPPPRTPVRDLPLENQDGILRFASEGPVKAARLGFVLALGSLFNWMRAVEAEQTGPIEIYTSPSHRSEHTPVESKIFFDGEFSGILYR